MTPERVFYPDDTPLTDAERKAIRKQGLGIDGPEYWRRRRFNELDDREIPPSMLDADTYPEDEVWD